MIGNIICCVCIMLPLGYLLGIRQGLGLWGIWGSMSVAWGVSAVLYLTILYNTDWDDQVMEAVKRLQAK